MAKVCREKGELRTLANQAKMRMKIGYWANMKSEREQAKTAAEAEGISPDAVNNFYRTKITRELKKNDSNVQDEEMYQKVCKMLDENEDILNPIGKLIDTQKFEIMDSKSRHRYIMMLSAKYQELSERYHNEKRGIN